MRCLLLATFALTACQSGRNAVPKGYVEDLKRICNAETMSGAAEQDPNRRSMSVAIWLGNQLVTPKARDLMAAQARLPPAEKATLLRAEAKQAGLSGCPTADAWQ